MKLFMAPQFRILALCALLSGCGGSEQQSTPKPLAEAAVVPLQVERAPVPELGPAPELPPGGIIGQSGNRPLNEILPRSGGLVLNTSDRESVRLFYLGLFPQSDRIPMGWTGNYNTGNPGTVSAAYQAATVLRINWFRAMAGVPADISLSDIYSAKAQKAALMMSANNTLNHFPPTSWIYYTAEGAEAASSSNLALGIAGPEAVSGYMSDNGSNNAAAGHRRWLLYPQTRTMGSGSVPVGVMGATSVSAANAIWVFDGNYGTARPTTREDFVAWPPKGYSPYQTTPGRWSLSYPNADFSGARVSVIKDGVAIGVQQETIAPGAGDNSIVWLLAGTDFSTFSYTRPGKDDVYKVTVDNISVAGVARSISYDVIIFDPDTPTPNVVKQTLNASPTSTFVNQTVQFSPSAMPGASGYQLQPYLATSTSGSFIFGSSASDWTSTTSGYSPIEGSTFHLYNATYEQQTLTSTRTFYIDQGAHLLFDRSIGLATNKQTARIQISKDGVSWQDVFVESGTGTSVPKASKDIDLASLAGSVVKIRFTLESGGFFYPQPISGWFFSNVSLTNVRDMKPLAPQIANGAAPTMAMSFDTTGIYVVTAQPQYQGLYFGDVSPGISIQVAGPSLPATVNSFSPANAATGVAVGSNIVLTFNGTIARGTGSIILTTAAGNIIETFDAATSSRLSISGSTLTIDPTSDLANSTNYSVTFAAGNIKDLAGNAYAGTTSYGFTTIAATSTLPATTSGTKAKVFLGVNDKFTVNDSGAILIGNLGSNTVKISAGVTGVKTDANFSRIELSGNLADYKFGVVMGTGLQIQTSAGVAIDTIVSLNSDVTVAFANGSTTLAQTGITAFSLGGQTIGTSTPATVVATLNAADKSSFGTATARDITKAKIYMGVNDSVTVSDSGATVVGNLGSNTVKIASGVVGVKTDANFSRIELGGNLADYKLGVISGTGLQIQTADGIAVNTLVSLNSDVTLAFSNGSAKLVQTGITAFTLGGQTISTTLPAVMSVTLNTADASSLAGKQ